MRKARHLLLPLSLLLCAGAQAAPILSLSGPQTVSQGEADVVYSIDLSDDGGGIDIGGATLVLPYDTAVFSYVGAAAGSLITAFDSFSANTGGAEITVAIGSAFGITSAGDLGSITFDVLSDAPPPATTFAFDETDSQVLNSDLGPVTPAYEDLTIVVTASVPAPGGALLLALGLAAMRGVRRRASARGPAAGPQLGRQA